VQLQSLNLKLNGVESPETALARMRSCTAGHCGAWERCASRHVTAYDLDGSDTGVRDWIDTEDPRTGEE